MFRNKKHIVAGLVLGVAMAGGFISSCRTDAKIIPEISTEDVSFRIPQGFPQPVYTFTNNPVTPDGFKLGRRLFYEPKLSADNSVSCGFCHQQPNAFANANHQFSHGIGGQLGTRNTPAIFNMAWTQLFMWDGGINHIESQPLGPITNPVEMGETLSNVITKLNADASYRAQFNAAFGDDSITTQRICQSLAQFMGLMISSNSKYDQYSRGETQLNTQEANGLAVFRTKCASCHSEPLFTDNSFHNNGLAVDNTLDDYGRMTITALPSDSLKFKTPSLRNITVTGPYMHDGRFLTLEECLDHYSSGVVSSSTLDPQLTGGIALTPQQKADIIVFLGTLTDFTYLNDSRFAE
ncbi:MAG: cytochrome-c peroxidase [Bacteroidota bacterium]|nr:cytochrome-c peroxidase [Bacteroidota bacterium]